MSIVKREHEVRGTEVDPSIDFTSIPLPIKIVTFKELLLKKVKTDISDPIMAIQDRDSQIR